MECFNLSEVQNALAMPYISCAVPLAVPGLGLCTACHNMVVLGCWHEQLERCVPHKARVELLLYYTVDAEFKWSYNGVNPAADNAYLLVG